ncbi:hypothetical protein JQN63_18110 [Delftia lacustris]|uniref:hypothetical protein n=1 Tax=Delftia TaxID=80865 RepID=UPI000FF8B78A|nr:MULTISPECIES: hypothetical protein [Delftia]QRI88321.1 hypothetical protein JQN63_18110 [Delftia lacustris]
MVDSFVMAVVFSLQAIVAAWLPPLPAATPPARHCKKTLDKYWMCSQLLLYISPVIILIS